MPAINRARLRGTSFARPCACIGRTTRRLFSYCVGRRVDGVRVQPTRRHGACQGPRSRDVGAGSCGHPCAEASQPERTRTLVRLCNARARSCAGHGHRSTALTNGAPMVRRAPRFRAPLNLVVAAGIGCCRRRSWPVPVDYVFLAVVNARKQQEGREPRGGYRPIVHVLELRAGASDLPRHSQRWRPASPITFGALRRSSVSWRVESWRATSSGLERSRCSS